MPDASEPPYRILATETLHDGWPPVRRHLLEFPDGRRRQWIAFEFGDGAAVAAITRAGKLVLTRQRVVGIDEPAYVLPGGVTNEGESFAETARRELLEETGYRANVVEPLFRYVNLPSYSSGWVHLFLALDVEPATPSADPVEVMGVELFDIGEAVAMAMDGRFAASSTAMAVLALPHALAARGRDGSAATP